MGWIHTTNAFRVKAAVAFMRKPIAQMVDYPYSRMVKGICMNCQAPAHLFTDDLSVKEWTISGMCQRCQNETFGKDEA